MRQRLQGARFNVSGVLGVVAIHVGVESLDELGIGDGVRRLVQTSSADDDCAHGTPMDWTKTRDFATIHLLEGGMRA